MGLDIMYINGREIFYTFLILSYVCGGVGLFLSFFRPGINPNIPVARGMKEFVLVLSISIFWPIYAILSIAYHGYNLLINHKDA